VVAKIAEAVAIGLIPAINRSACNGTCVRRRSRLEMTL